MHLTNYAINKKSKNFKKGEDEDTSNSSKRSLESIFDRIEEDYGVKRDVIWDRIADLVNKTVISVQPELSHIYKASQSGDRLGKICF